MKNSYIYIIGSIEQFNVVKIGITKNLPHLGRLQQLQTGNPYELKVWSYFPCANQFLLKCEKQIHDYFSEVRLSGEWFKIKPQEAYSVVSEIVEKTHLIKKNNGQKAKMFCGKEQISILADSKNERAIKMLQQIMD